MKLSRFLKTIFMTDFVGGLFIAIKELFKSKKQSTIHSKKEKLALDLEVSMHLEDIRMEKKDVLPVNYVKPFVLLKQLQLNLLQEKMVAERLLDTILI
jgi:hypothetical protein